MKVKNKNNTERSKKMKSVRKQTLLFGGLIVATATIIWHYLPHSNLLIKRAKVITYFPKPIFQSNFQVNYYWVSDQEIIAFSPVDITKKEISMYPLFKINALNGKQISMSTFNNAFQKEINKTTFVYTSSTTKPSVPLRQRINFGCSISPDSKWMLWGTPVSTKNGHIKSHYDALSLDGTCRISWPSAEDSAEPLWLPDSLHWIDLSYNGNTFLILLHDINRPYYVKAIKIRHFGSEWKTLLGISKTGEFVTLVDPERYFVRGISYIKNQPAELDEICMDGDYRTNANTKVATTRKLFACLPPVGNMYTFSLFLSPHGDKLAWFVIGRYSPQGPSWLQKIYAFLGYRTHAVCSLWVSMLDGSQMHEIGELDLTSHGEIPYNICWTPNGHELSFEYRNAIYTVPID